MARTSAKAPNGTAGRRPEKPLTPELLLLGQRIKRLREERGLRGSELGLHPTCLSYVERGRQNVTFTQLVTIAAHLGMSVQGLVTLPRSPQSN